MERKMTADDIAVEFDSHWHKMAAVILWKCRGSQSLVVTAKDLEQFSAHFLPGIPVLVTNAYNDSIELKVIDEESAKQLGWKG